MYAGNPIESAQSVREREARVRLQEESAADFTAQLHMIGLTDRAAWLPAVVLFGTLGSAFVMLGLLHQVPSGVTKMGTAGIVASLVSVYGMLHWTASPRAAHVRVSAGVVMIFWGMYLAGPLAPAVIMAALFTVLTPCYLYGPRFAVPYGLIVFTLTGITMGFAPGPQPPADGVMVVFTMFMIVASMIISERRTRSLARYNRRLAYTDPLTGIANTRRLRQRLTNSLKAFTREGQSFALFAIDLDNFKLVNDVFDHGTGDMVLQAVARELADELEPGDLVVRRGGDEFSVLVTGTRERDLDGLCDRLNEAIKRARMETCPTITPSGSVAYVRARTGDDLSSILKRADDALHRVKRALHDIHGEREDFERADTADEALRAQRRHDDFGGVQPVERLGLVKRMLGALSDTVTALNPLWGFTSFTFVPIGLVTGLLAALGQLEPLARLTGAAISAGFVVLGVAGYLAGRRNTPLRYLHPVYLTAIGLLTLAVALAGSAGSALIDVYLMLMLFAYYFFVPRAAALYAVACVLLFSGFAFSSYANAGARVAVSMTVMIVGISLVVKMRSITVSFARTNRELSEIDALTGLANVGALRRRVATAIGTATTSGPRPALISLDLDKFKRVNDHYNHTTGDQVLVAVSRAISETVREEDLVVRRGGDEFVVLTSFNEPHELDALVARLGQAIVHARLRICPDLVASASIGWSPWDIGEDADKLLAKSDVVLHSEKSAARGSRHLRAVS